MSIGMIKNYDLIQEDCRVDDLLDFSVPIEKFKRTLSSINRSAIVALIGPFGSGKSTMLYQIKKANEDKQLWINFDAWKYPDRKDLWEGFVIDFAEQVGEKEKITGRIDGTNFELKAAESAVDIISPLFLNIPKSILGLYKVFVEKSPAKRVFDIQRILCGLINDQDEEVYVILEDIDRSRDAGINFLETLKQFIRDNDLKNKIVAIVPMAECNFNDHKESYYKCIDYFEQFSLSGIGLTKFIESVIEDDLLNGKYKYSDELTVTTNKDNKMQIVTFFEEVFKSHLSMTIRLLKLIIRNADVHYKSQVIDNHRPDWRVTLCFETAKHLKSSSDRGIAYIDQFKENGYINRESIFASLMCTIINKSNDIYDPHKNLGQLMDSKFDIKLITRIGPTDYASYPSSPYVYGDRFEGKTGFGVCDFYLNY